MVQVDAEISGLIPPLDEEERATLEASLVAEGCRVPLDVWGDTLLDGHNRLEICERLLIPYTVRQVDGVESREDAILWVIQNQLGRRNLHPLDKVPLLERRRAILEAQAREAQGHGLTAPGRTLGQNFSEASPGRVNVTLSKAAGVSRPTYEALKDVSERGTEELKAAVRSGRVGASFGREIASLDDEVQRRVVSEADKRGMVVEFRKHVHVGENSGCNEWYTPPEIIQSVRDVLGEIDLDPASSAVANKTVGAKKFFTAEDDALHGKVWKGRVFMNPPYAQPLVEKFCLFLRMEFVVKHVTEAIALVNNATETNWFDALTQEASSICFLRGRVKFLDPAGNPGAPLQGQALVYLGENKERFHEVFTGWGLVVDVVEFTHE